MRRFYSVSTIMGNDEKCACVLCCSSHENSHRAPVCRACTNATSGFELRKNNRETTVIIPLVFASRYFAVVCEEQQKNKGPVILLLFARNSRKNKGKW
jgi:hypothetical protein